MAMTMTEKILAKHAGRAQVKPGENVWIDVDILMTHDVCGPGTIGVFKKNFGENAKVFDRERVVIIPDHYIFTADQKANRNVEILREFVREQQIKYYYDPGTKTYKGVCHVALPEEGHTRPGEVLFGTDSHTCTHGAFGEFASGIGNTDAGFVMGTGKLWVKVPPTMRFVFHGQLPPYLMAKDLILAVIGDIGVDGATYKTMEFAGEGVYGLNIEERMTLCNMVIEAGAKNGMIAPDEVTLSYVKAHNSGRPFEVFENDADAQFAGDMHYDLEKMEPMVAKPHSPDNKATVSEIRGLKLDRAYIGSCTGGKLTDFLAAARILAGQKTRIDTFIVPATTEVDQGLDNNYYQGKSLRQIFEDAGCRVGPPSCAACLGGPVDTFGRMNEPNKRCISSTNRNFPGRMGNLQSEVYLASPMTVAASAVQGAVADPREFLQ